MKHSGNCLGIEKQGTLLGITNQFSDLVDIGITEPGHQKENKNQREETTLNTKKPSFLFLCH